MIDEIENVKHAEEEAQSWIRSMAPILRRTNRARSHEDRESARTEIRESPLSVEVRSGWVSSGDQMEAEEFSICVGDGGPATRIRGVLKNGVPATACFEWQHWGTPWVEAPKASRAGESVLLEYAAYFFFD